MGDISSTRSICYQGIEGSYSHSLASAIEPQAKLRGFQTFDEAMEAVERGNFDLALIPIENNIGGRVAEIHHLLADTELKIVAEYFLQIEHCLLVLPDGDVRQVKRVYSHPQALLQCRRFIRDHDLVSIAESDTAVAAKVIGQRKEPQCAAIASSDCAAIYGLKIAHRAIANDSDNITRFIAMRREGASRDSDANGGKEMRAGTDAAAHAYSRPITALLFQLRSVPAALYKALGGFATNGINLTKLESYIEPRGLGVARFYAEIAADIHAPSSEHALDELRYFAEWVKVIGTFEQNRTPIIIK